ncbi:unnamed protein product [Phytophthora lilii]|uniref:Unnamed protein product n=1 Tax=Phytophthora lilii TaxID=2077276 RepID=A0A9W6TAQ2_9STRA|nr:unnamed protein product [Phytophthora lilii]
MNVWTLDNEPELSRPPVTKKACFADEVEVASTTGWGTDSWRRKQRAKVEFLVDDHQNSDDEESGGVIHKKLDSHYSSDALELASSKANEVISADIVKSVDGVGPVQTFKSKPEQQHENRERGKRSAKTNQEITVHHLVREFLLMHCHEDVVKILDRERERTAPAEKKTRTKESSTSRRKPALNVITTNLEQHADPTSSSTQVDCDYNRLNHPGSTPHHQTQGSVIGEPGSTPMARARDLRALGYEDIDEDGSKLTSGEQTHAVGDLDNSSGQLSDYAIRKRASTAGPKRVQLGNPGSTPTKEYIFFRETPPSFVTETIEEAVEVFEKLGNDPEFVKQAAVAERFIELQSSEVSKYTVDQTVDGLGAQSDISGVVAKIYGSRLCGTAGPGTIVIDTCPEENVSNSS